MWAAVRVQLHDMVHTRVLYSCRLTHLNHVDMQSRGNSKEDNAKEAIILQVVKNGVTVTKRILSSFIDKITVPLSSRKERHSEVGLICEYLI